MDLVRYLTTGTHASAMDPTTDEAVHDGSGADSKSGASQITGKKA